MIYKPSPIGAIVRYGKTPTVRLLRFSVGTRPSRKHKAKRGKVTYLSRKSLNNLTFLLNVAQVDFASMLTINYLCPPPTGRRAKRDLRYVLGWLERRFKYDDSFGYVWFAEFTRRGSVHFHILLTVSPTDRLRERYAIYWQRVSRQGEGSYYSFVVRRTLWVQEAIIEHNKRPEVWAEARSPEGLRHYANMYAQKPEQKKVPEWFVDIGRFWGCSKRIKEKMAEPRIDCVTEDEVREKLSASGNEIGQWDILPKFIWNYPDV